VSRSVAPINRDSGRRLGVGRVERLPGERADAGQELLNGFGQDQRETVPFEAVDGGGQLGHGVVGVQHRAVPGGAARRQAQPQHALLGGLDQVGPGAAERDREAADLAQRLGRAGEELRLVLDQPARPDHAAGLLVGEKSEDHIPRGYGVVALELARDGESHRDHALHVDRAAAPHVAVADLPGEGMHRPVGGVGRHHVEVAVHQQRAARRIGAGQPDDHIAAPPGARFDIGDLVAHLGELARDILRGRLFCANFFRITEIACVDRDQLAGQRDHLGDRDRRRREVLSGH
jgi:hypothetical protein